MQSSQRRLRSSTLAFSGALLVSVVALGAALDHYARTRTDATAQHVPEQRSELGRVQAPERVRQLAQWAVDSGDAGGRPFVIVDKAQARLYAFGPQGRLSGSTPVLLGASRGDAWQPEGANTPAGRFVADARMETRRDGLLWVDGEAALRLLAPGAQPAPGRAELRLASDRVDDRRISDGSLHVPAKFWWEHMAGLQRTASVAYVLPETRQRPLLAQSHRRADEGRNS
jgi:hypothetical protein